MFPALCVFYGFSGVCIFFDRDFMHMILPFGVLNEH